MINSQSRLHELHALTYDSKNILGLLTKQSIQIESANTWHQDMVSVSQLLCIGNLSVCSDQLLIQRVHYATLDGMQREISTLTVKKEVFSDFESTITLIPKYCYTLHDSSSALFVHPVPCITLENILSTCEQLFPAEYNQNQIHYFCTWTTSVLSRYRSGIPDNKRISSRVVSTLHSLFSLAPPTIPLRQRKQFAAQLVNTVLKHHTAGIHHDCITPYTLFFRSPNQPVVLANYTGIASTIVQDFFPADFNEMAPFFSSHNPHMRDLLCLSLITGRILSGEPVDPSQPFIDAPRPFTIIIKNLIDKSELLKKHPLQDSFLYLESFSFIMHHLLHMSLEIFETNRFSNWRKLNRATGLIWRSIPVLGPISDIFFPTRCASMLRSLLNKHWFQFQFISKSDSKNNLPSLTDLLSVLKTNKFTNQSYYKSVFFRLQGEAAKKRHTFDSIMETTSDKSITNNVPLRKYISLATTGFILILLAISGFQLFRLPQRDVKHPVTEHKTEVIALIPSTPELTQHVTPVEFADTIKQTPPSVITLQQKPEKSSAKESHPKKPVQKKVIKKKAVPLPPPSVVTPTEILIPDIPFSVCRLAPATTMWKVFTIEGACETCNLADIVQIDETTGDSLRIGETTDRLNRYYIARKTNSGYEKIITTKWCTDDQCIKGILYEDNNETTYTPATVSPGDLIGFNYLSINAYIIKDNRSRRQ